MERSARAIFGDVRRRLEKDLKQYDLTLKSAGTKDEEMKQPLDTDTGYWADVKSIASKPPRWIVQFYKDNDEVIARIAINPGGEFYNASHTLGAINNREGNCGVMVFRTLAAIKDDDLDRYIFPNWEWLLVVTPVRRLPSGTSSDVIKLNPQQGTIIYQQKTYKVSKIGIVTTEVKHEKIHLSSAEKITYSEATDALKALLTCTVSKDE
jgi:hypothetical protein